MDSKFSFSYEKTCKKMRVMNCSVMDHTEPCPSESMGNESRSETGI